MHCLDRKNGAVVWARRPVAKLASLRREGLRFSPLGRGWKTHPLGSVMARATDRQGRAAREPFASH